MDSYTHTCACTCTSQQLKLVFQNDCQHVEINRQETNNVLKHKPKISVIRTQCAKQNIPEWKTNKIF